jgi:hypothetical protein
MTSEVKRNKEFAKWIGIAAVQQNRPSIERTLHEKTASPDGQEHSDGAHLFGPKLHAATGRYVARRFIVS